MTAAVTLPPANAALVAAGVQTIVTLPTKPKALTAGDRLVIHAGTMLPKRRDEDFLGCEPLGDWQPVVDCPPPYLEHWARGMKGAPDDILMRPGHIVASAVVRDVVPIANFFTASCPGDDTPHLCMYGDQSAQLYPGSEEPQHGDDVTDQLPFSDFTPGRWAVLLDDVTPTTDRRPACWGRKVRAVSGDEWLLPGCDVCGATGTCPPIPWKGKPGVWEVTW